MQSRISENDIIKILRVAITKNQDATVETYLEKAKDNNIKLPGDLIESAITLGDLGMLRRLLSYKENIQVPANILHFAVNNNKVEALGILLEFNAGDPTFKVSFDPKTSARTPIANASFNQQWECVNVLFNHLKEDENDKYQFGCVLLFALNQKKEVDLIRRLVSAKPRYTWSFDGDKSTTLHLAVQNYEPEIAALMVKDGADINTCNSNGESPLQLATSLEKWEHVNALAYPDKFLEQHNPGSPENQTYLQKASAFVTDYQQFSIFRNKSKESKTFVSTLITACNNRTKSVDERANEAQSIISDFASGKAENSSTAMRKLVVHGLYSPPIPPVKELYPPLPGFKK